MPIVIPPVTPIETTGNLVVSFESVTPPVRNDGIPWTQVQIREAPSLRSLETGEIGPFVLIDTQALTPVDADPTNPAVRYFTTSNALEAEGFYTLTYVDALGASSHPAGQSQDAGSQIRPSVSDLGAFMRGRTIAAGTGSEIGTFNFSTRPTAVEADLLIDQAVSSVLMQTGADVPDSFISQAQFAVLLYAAMLVELTFYRNEVSRDQSAYLQYEQLYKDAVAALRMAIAEEDPASPEASFLSVPIINSAQARFQFVSHSFDPVAGTFDPAQLPPDMYYPNGVGGIPPNLYKILPWLGLENAFGFDMGLAWLEAPD